MVAARRSGDIRPRLGHRVQVTVPQDDRAFCRRRRPASLYQLPGLFPDPDVDDPLPVAISRKFLIVLAFRMWCLGLMWHVLTGSVNTTGSGEIHSSHSGELTLNPTAQNVPLPGISSTPSVGQEVILRPCSRSWRSKALATTSCYSSPRLPETRSRPPGLEVPGPCGEVPHGVGGASVMPTPDPEPILSWLLSGDDRRVGKDGSRWMAAAAGLLAAQEDVVDGDPRRSSSDLRVLSAEDVPSRPRWWPVGPDGHSLVVLDTAENTSRWGGGP